MASKIKVRRTEITNILNEINAKLEDMTAVYKEIKKNSTLVKESWQSEAALKSVENIEKQSDKLKKAIQQINKESAVIKDTSNRVIESDRQIANKIIKIMNS